jgi:hypothetical protein
MFDDDGLYFRLPNAWVTYEKVFPHPTIKAIHRMEWTIKSEIREWLAENNIKVDYSFNFTNLNTTKSDCVDLIHLIHFRTKGEAVQFRMRWG